MALAYRYVPRWERDLESLEEYYARYDASSETRALQDFLRDTPRLDWQQWYGFLDGVSEALPERFALVDRTSWIKPCFSAVIEWPGDDPAEERILVIYASRLEPLYYVYDSTSRRIDGEYQSPRIRYRLPLDAAPLQAILEREFGRLGYERLSPEHGKLPVPDVSVGNLEPGQVTLADVLFSDHRW